MLNNKNNFLFKKINLLRLIVIVGSVLLFAGGPDFYSPRSFKNFWDLGHILFFSILSYLILLSWSQNGRMPLVLQAICILSIALFLGTLIEIAQAGSRRSPDVLDIFRNIIGCLITLSFFAPSTNTIPKFFLRVLQATTLLLVTAALFPAFKSITDEIVALRQFPVLSDFETPFETNRWSGGTKLFIDHTIYFHGKSSMKVALDTSRYSGVTLKYFPGNWVDYKTLQLGIFNPDSNHINITCRIHDKRHTEGVQKYIDRFNRTYSLQKGWNLIKIPLKQVKNAPEGRDMDLDQIRAVGIFSTSLLKPAVIYIDSVLLTNQPNE